MHFPRHKLEIEIDEKGHSCRDKKNKMKEKKNIKKELGCESVRINLDEKDYAKYIV